MIRQSAILTVGAVCAIAALWGCEDVSQVPTTDPALIANSETAPQAASPTDSGDAVEIDPQMLAAFRPPLEGPIESASNPITDEKLALGKLLFHDTRLSKNHDISCNSCHTLEAFGVDGKPTSDGHKGKKGARNSPTVFNAAGHIAQFWDGRAADVEEQAKGPVLNPDEMAMPDEKTVLRVLKSIPEYVEAFAKAFPESKPAVSYENFGKAVGAFERTLVTPSPWDAFLKGDSQALTGAQKQGFKEFMAAGCNACHMGTHLGGSMFQKVGLIEPWPDQKDQGRYEVTKNEADKMMFKVPSLRNITQTAPYFHDGSETSLANAVRMMGKHQLGKTLDDQQVEDIVAFLGALEGELPADAIVTPELPKSTAKTPKPDPN